MDSDQAVQDSTWRHRVRTERRCDLVLGDSLIYIGGGDLDPIECLVINLNGH